MQRSVFAAPGGPSRGLRPLRLRRRALIAASLAVEDECLARGDRSVVLGAFQLGHRFALAAPLGGARSHRGLGRGRRRLRRRRRPSGGRSRAASPVRCRLRGTRQCVGSGRWSDSATYAALVAAWEVPVATGPPAYEAVISTHRPAAVAAARVIAGVVRAAGGGGPPAAEQLLSGPPRAGDRRCRRGPHLAAGARPPRPPADGGSGRSAAGAHARPARAAQRRGGGRGPRREERREVGGDEPTRPPQERADATGRSSCRSSGEPDRRRGLVASSSRCSSCRASTCSTRSSSRGTSASSPSRPAGQRDAGSVAIRRRLFQTAAKPGLRQAGHRLTSLALVMTPR